MRQKNTVFGQTLPAPRLTPLGAALLALAIALPCGGVLGLLDWLFF
ncbi:hypothetical protein [uncultured Lentibacter sp.]|nr:hypothetical protein [uncultured Lentibacter sp.]MCW1956546.1 hypothetical protein [Roseobacter sp.]